MKTGLKYLVTMGLLIFIGCSKDDPDSIDNTISINIRANSNTASEPDIHTFFTVTLSETSEENIEVHYNIGGNASNGVDYSKIEGVITIPPNTLKTTIPVTIIDDNDAEEIETVALTLVSTDNPNIEIGTNNSASIQIYNEPEEFLLSPSEAKSYIANPNATDETIALFYNLNKIARTHFIVGQHDAFSSFLNNDAGISDMKKSTGYDPGLLGSDFMFITDDKNSHTSGNWFFQQEQNIKNDIIEAYNKGMVNTLLWHMREPYEGQYFYTNGMTDFQKNNALISILPDGENHDYYKTKLDKIAEFSKNLIGNDGKLIPIIFRPFHEFDGDWFWWGAPYCSPQQYIDLWRFTVDYLRKDKGVNNMLFAYSSDRYFNSRDMYLERYPGDAFVDVLGMDNYGDFNNQGSIGFSNANVKLKILTDLAKEKVKIAALTESCYFVTPAENAPIPEFYSKHLYNALTENDVKPSYMMFWSNSLNSYCVPTPEQSSFNDFLAFTEKDNALLQNKLPNVYDLPE